MAFLLKSISWLALCCVVVPLTPAALPCPLYSRTAKLGIFDLFRLGNDEKAPFSTKSVHRMTQGKLDNSTAPLHSDVIIMNKLPMHIVLQDFGCREGEFRKDFTPEVDMRPKSSAVFGIQSRSTGQRAELSCSVRYDIEDERDGPLVSFLKLGIIYPAEGELTFHVESNGFVRISTVVMDNQIRFVLDPSTSKRLIFKDPLTNRAFDMED